jgi:hypothetical protein
MFLSPLQVELVEEGEGTWTLLSPLVYQAESTTYTVPVGFITDFASVPRLPFIYAMYGNRAHKAATLHDYLCRTGLVSRRKADDLFYDAMIASGIEEKYASMMHLAVRSYSSSLELEGPEGKGYEFI